MFFIDCNEIEWRTYVFSSKDLNLCLYWPRSQNPKKSQISSIVSPVKTAVFSHGGLKSVSKCVLICQDTKITFIPQWRTLNALVALDVQTLVSHSYQVFCVCVLSSHLPWNAGDTLSPLYCTSRCFMTLFIISETHTHTHVPTL